MSESQSLIIPAGDGTLWQIGGEITCKVDSHSTGGAYTVITLLLQPEQGAPLHTHQKEDEVFYILAGECTVGIAGKIYKVGKDTTVRLPKGTPHFFKNETSSPCHILITAIPGGLDTYFAEVSTAIINDRADEIPTINERYQISFEA